MGANIKITLATTFEVGRILKAAEKMQRNKKKFIKSPLSTIGSWDNHGEETLSRNAAAKKGGGDKRGLNLSSPPPQEAIENDKKLNSKKK